LLKILKIKVDSIELFRSATTAIRTNKTRSFLTTLGIIIGVASVILLVSIGSGLQAYVTKQFESLGANLLFVAPGKVKLSGGGGGGGAPMSFTSKFTFDDVRELDRSGGAILAASGSLNRAGTAKLGSKTYDITLAGIDEKYPSMANIKVQSGQLLTKSMVERSQNTAVVGTKVLSNLFPASADPLGKQITVNDRKFTIIGVMESKGGGIGGGGDQDSIVLIPVTTAEKLLGSKNPGSIVVQATSSDAISQATNQIKKYFYRRNLTDDDFTVLEPKQILDTVNSFLGTITAALSGIAAISLVVGGIGIANIMLVSVTERTREIGLRKALGATRRDILLQFLIEAVVLSVLGGAIGISIGYGLSALMNKFIETSVTPGSVILAFGISLMVGVISGIAPAIRAAKLNPIEALRYE
jgi:putative ABC transport system permease protein